MSVDTLSETQPQLMYNADDTPIVIRRYPGQGSQKQSMGADICGDNDYALSTFDEGTRILESDGRLFEGEAIDLRYLCFEASDKELGQNHLTQLAIFSTTIAALRRIREERSDLD